MSTGSVDSRVPGTPTRVWTATVVLGVAVIAPGAAVVLGTAVVMAGTAVVLGTAVVVAGTTVVVTTAVVVGTAVVPVDEEQPAADTAQARRTGTNAGAGRTARPFRNRVCGESAPEGRTACCRVSTVGHQATRCPPMASGYLTVTPRSTVSNLTECPPTVSRVAECDLTEFDPAGRYPPVDAQSTPKGLLFPPTGRNQLW